MSRLAAALTERRRARASEPHLAEAHSSDMDRAARSPIFTLERVAVPCVALLASILFVTAYWRYGPESAVRVNGNHVTVSEVIEAVYHDYIPVTGYVVPRNTVYLDAVVGGQVTDVHVEEGALVQAGQALVTLKNTNLQLELIGREAQLAEQVNSLRVTQLSFEQNRLNAKRDLIQINHQIGQIERRLQRYQKLQQSGGISQEEIEELEAEYLFQKQLKSAIENSQYVDETLQGKQMEHLEESINNMEKNIAIARSNLDDLILRAPIDGQVTVLSAYPGESKAPGERLGQLDEVDSFKVSALIDEFYLARINLGQKAHVTINGVEHTLKVDKIYPNIKDRQFEVDLVFDETPQALRRGQTMRLNLEIGEPGTSLTVENGPFYDGSRGEWVFVLQDNGRTAGRREVKLGRRTPDRIEVISGLHQGEKIITSSISSFSNAQRLILEYN